MILALLREGNLAQYYGNKLPKSNRYFGTIENKISIQNLHEFLILISYGAKIESRFFCLQQKCVAF